MTSLELLESLAAVKGKYVLEAHGNEMPDDNIIPFDSSIKTDGSANTRRHKPMKRSVLIAIIAVATLMLAGFAYAIMKLQDISIGEYTYTEPNPLNPTEKVIVTNEFISLQGLQDSPEYQATKEWQDFLHSYDTDGAILAEIGNQPTGFENVSLFYQVYTQEMYDKLVEIAHKYGLMLHSELNIVSAEELNDRVGGSFIGEDISQEWGYIYENGTFQFEGEALLDGKIVHMQFRRSVKGTLDEPVLNIGSAEEYQEVQYETHCGETVLLALGTDHSLIYVDYEECFILMNVLAGIEEGFLDDAEGAITMEDLKRMADGIDFSMLSNVIKSDMRGDSVPETGSTSMDETEMQTDTVAEATEDSLFELFLRGEIAADGNGLYSDDSFYIDELVSGEETWDAYSVGGMLDLDNDGVDELILEGPYGGMYLDASSDTVRVWAAGEGTASNLSYVKCGGEVWIVHSDTLHTGRKYYHLQRYAGADKIAGDITLEIHYSAENKATYYLNGAEVSEQEYTTTYQTYLGDGRIEAYQSVLLDIYHNQQFPGGRELGYDGFDLSDNRFAIEDIDGDGNEELIVIYTTTYVAGHAEIIYDYDAATGSVREQFVEYPAVTHFDNGILKADWSHNQGLAGRIWPYTLYQYNPEKDIYEAIAMVDAWDKSLADTDYEGNAFPDGVDKDGDMLVYYIMPPDEYELKNPVDYEEFEKWFDSYRKDAEVVRPSYMELTVENIAKLE
uniref:hypothetical protein n=1 Tax=Agathobacter sp. TaxID=2021311 RepID=UPI0040571716